MQHIDLLEGTETPTNGRTDFCEAQAGDASACRAKLSGSAASHLPVLELQSTLELGMAVRSLIRHAEPAEFILGENDRIQSNAKAAPDCGNATFS
jgi:hypothetical protein